MDQETIQKIAAEVAKLVPNYDWALILIQAALTVAAAAAGAFLSEYLKTRGKHLATKADFDEVISQLRSTTQLVETVKAEVAQKDWAKREWTNLRRLKLEELLNLRHDCEAYADNRRYRAFEGKLFEEPDPAGKLQTLGALYFRELETELRNYVMAHSELNLTAGTLAGAVNQARGDKTAFDAAVADFNAGFRTRVSKVLATASELEKAARKLLIKIVGAED